MTTSTWLGMTQPHYETGGNTRRAIVLHATAGRAPSDLAWLRKGGDRRRPVSAHYYIDKAGAISQLVRDEDVAWHAGRSTWDIDGQRVEGLNGASIGIELSNRNDGVDPYPDAQYRAAVGLTRGLIHRYEIPRAQVVRHLDISPGRKSDPAGFPWGRFLDDVFVPSVALYTPDSPIIGPPLGTEAQARAWLTARSTQYDAASIARIVGAYARIGAAAGVDWFLALAQLAHETGSLTAALSGRPVRNPAGIGVTGQTSAGPAEGYVWDRDRSQWRAACTFVAWTPEEAGGAVSSVEAHLGRLIAYAVPPSSRFGPQVDLADRALRVRPLSLAIQGRHLTVGSLGGVWAVDAGYGGRVAALAERMRQT